MKPTDVLVCSLAMLCFIFLISIYFAVRGKKGLEVCTSIFAEGGAETIAGSYLVIAGITWCIQGALTRPVIAIAAFAVVAFFVGRWLGRVHNRLRGSAKQ